MNRRKSDSRIVRDDCFRAVAVMRVKIPNRDAFGAIFKRIKRSDGDVAEITKTHRAIARGVMTGRPHQAESAVRRATPRCAALIAAPADRAANS